MPSSPSQPAIDAAYPLDAANLSSDESFDSSDDGEHYGWFSDAENEDGFDSPNIQPSSAPATPTRTPKAAAGTPPPSKVAGAPMPHKDPELASPLPPSSPPLPSSPPPRDIMDIPTSELTSTKFTSPPPREHTARVAWNRARGQEKRRETLSKKARTAAAAQAAYTARLAERAEEEQERRRLVCLQALDLLTEQGVGLGEFLLFVLDPANRMDNLALVRWKGLLRNRTFVEQVMSFWASNPRTPSTVRRRVSKWMVTHVGSLAAREARSVTKLGWLRVSPQDMTSEAILSFSLEGISEKLEEHAPAAMSVMRSFATAPKQIGLGPGSRVMQRKTVVLGQAATSLLREHSRGNNLVSSQVGLYLYVSGAQRQTISVISHLGASCSYSALVGKAKWGTRQLPATAQLQRAAPGPPANAQVPAHTAVLQRAPGILPVLSKTCMSEAQKLAATDEYPTTYDNLNVTYKAAEQIMGRKDSQENGTCCTLTSFHGHVGNALDFDAAERQFRIAAPLQPKDILMVPTERVLWRDLSIETIISIIVTYGQGYFERFEPRLRAWAPRDSQAIEVHRTDIYPIQTMHIDESSIRGNVEVVDAVHKQLNVDTTAPKFMKRVRLFFGDQLTLARIRAVVSARTGHEPAAQGWRWAKTVQGLFHVEMTATHNTLATHWGKPNSGARNPGSLAYHNTVLDRKPIVVTSLPPFRICRDLIAVSLYARVLCCLLQVTGHRNLEECGTSITWDQLRTAAGAIYDTYASTATVARLRRARTEAPEGTAAGDVVFENALLFMRDALALRTFGRLVKAGRSGHLVLAIKVLLLGFKGGGHNKYALEMLHLLHNLLNVWPEALRKLVLNNWLVNPTGTADGFVSLDLMQEHLNFWIKRVYNAHGSNASWEWLATVSPCIDLLRKLANHMHTVLGSRQGKKHCPADLTRDINVLIANLTENQVYVEQPARRVDADDPPAVDVTTRGLELLTSGAKNPLREFNDTFATLQRRSKVKPLLPFVPAAQGAPAPAPQSAQSRASEPRTAQPDASAVPNEENEIGEEEDELDQWMIEQQDNDADLEDLFSREDEGDVDLDPDVYATESESGEDSDGEGGRD